MVGNKVKERELTTTDRKAAYYMVLGFCEDGKPKRGACACVAPHFSVAPETVARLWKKSRAKLLLEYPPNHDDDNDNHQYLMDKSKGLPDAFFASGASTRRKGKFIHDREELKAAVLELPRNKRRKLRHLAANLDIPLTTVYKFLKEHKIFRRHSSPVKPSLTLSNKHDRLLYALEKIEMPRLQSTRGGQATLKFHHMYNEIHVDEKWFFVCRDGESCILVADEEDPPDRYVKHKSHITKVMFLCAVARPRKIHNQWWDGKIGIWPVGYYRNAIRDSSNRPAGTRLFESETIDMDKCRDVMTGLVLPATLNEFPTSEFNRYEHIIVQQDGAPTHMHPRDSEWMECLTVMGLEDKIKLITQPANSPDLNINDLGFFNALQAAYYCTCPKNQIELIDMVSSCFNEFPTYKINRIWLTYMSMLNEVILAAGCNKCKIPHMNKDKLEREGRLPTALEVNPAARYYLDN